MSDVVLVNAGDGDVAMPTRVALPAPCTLGDGVNGYVRVIGPTVALERTKLRLLRGHARATIGWARCAVASGDIHVEP